MPACAAAWEIPMKSGSSARLVAAADRRHAVARSSPVTPPRARLQQAPSRVSCWWPSPSSTTPTSTIPSSCSCIMAPTARRVWWSTGPMAPHRRRNCCAGSASRARASRARRGSSMAGPCSRRSAWSLHSTDYASADTRRVTADLAVTSNPAILADIAERKGPAHALPVLGYAGWARGPARERAGARGLVHDRRPTRS